tara:strand:+ start:2963 stop:3706 length:744 start_codon:yes stop_codon:yes gene_type:complete
MSIEDAVAEAVEEQVESAISNLDLVDTDGVEEVIDNYDFSGVVEEAVENAITNYDFSMTVAEHIDYTDIRYNIEDDILYQVNDHIDIDLTDYGIDDTVQDIIQGFIFEGCSDMDVAADHILKRGMNGRNKWFIPTEEQWNNRHSDNGLAEEELHDLRVRITGLEATVARLLEFINLPEVKAPTEALVDAINNGEVSSKDAQFAVAANKLERYQMVRYMSKPELVAWATENGYDVDGMTVAQIHDVVL